jgi:hypothetical protein
MKFSMRLLCSACRGTNPDICSYKGSREAIKPAVKVAELTHRASGSEHKASTTVVSFASQSASLTTCYPGSKLL